MIVRLFCNQIELHKFDSIHVVYACSLLWWRLINNNRLNVMVTERNSSSIKLKDISFVLILFNHEFGSVFLFFGAETIFRRLIAVTEVGFAWAVRY